jgi:N-acetylglucosamine-6-phosphate deacetylase
VKRLPWLMPALFDPQINGFGGVDYQRDDLTPETLRHSVRTLRRTGCTRFLLTLITAPWETLLARLERLRAWRSADPELAAAIVGWHVEGPFLSAEPGYCGAHVPEWMRDPRLRDLRALRAVTGRDRVLLTLAPERKGGLAAVREAARLGFRVSLGHTNAPAETLAAAVAAGATGFTHLGNGCPQLLDRHDSVLWRVLDQPGLTVSLIADGLHVAPALFRLVHRALPTRRVIHITDAMSAAGAPPGRYTVGDRVLNVGRDRVVRLPGQTNFAGSALTPIEGVFRAATMLRRPWREVWAASATIPANWLGLRLGLTPGRRADFCLVRVDADECLRELRTLCAGEEGERFVPDPGD